jgi:hypothetical protein
MVARCWQLPFFIYVALGSAHYNAIARQHDNAKYKAIVVGSDGYTFRLSDAASHTSSWGASASRINEAPVLQGPEERKEGRRLQIHLHEGKDAVEDVEPSEVRPIRIEHLHPASSVLQSKSFLTWRETVFGTLLSLVLLGCVMAVLGLLGFTFSPLSMHVSPSMLSQASQVSNNGDGNDQWIPVQGVDFDWEQTMEDDDDDDYRGRARNDFSRLLKWYSREEVEELDLETQTSSRSASFVPMPVDASDGGVKLVLQRFNATVSAERLQGIVGMVSRHEAFLADRLGPGGPCLYLVTEEVRLLCVHATFLLLEKGGASQPLKQLAYLKRSDESPLEAARRFFVNEFGMLDGNLQFVESSVVDTKNSDEDAEKFKSILRTHVVTVCFERIGQSVGKLMGLPDHVPCKTSEQVSRNLVWAPLAEAREYFIVALQKEEYPQRVAHLSKQLESHKVDVAQWTGEGFTQTLRDLKVELSAGGVVLEVQKDNTMKRITDLVTLRLASMDGKYLLVEVGRRTKDGVARMRPRLPSSRRWTMETVHKAAERLCFSKLGFNTREASVPQMASWEYNEFSASSVSWPGLDARYRQFFVDARVRQDRSPHCPTSSASRNTSDRSCMDSVIVT